MSHRSRPQNPTPRVSTSSQTSNTSWLRKLLRRWKSKDLQGTAPKVLFMAGFLINSTAMSGLFYLLNQDWNSHANSSSNLCLALPNLYEYSMDMAFPFFVFLSIFIFTILCLMQCRRQKLDKNVYKVITMLAAVTLVVSILLVLISSSAIFMQTDEDQCEKESTIWQLKLRYIFQSTASLITASIYLIVGASLVRNRTSYVAPVPPQTPIYQISPPEFDSLFPIPPPSYQQSQMHHQRSTNNVN